MEAPLSTIWKMVNLLLADKWLFSPMLWVCDGLTAHCQGEKKLSSVGRGTHHTLGQLRPRQTQTLELNSSCDLLTSCNQAGS